MNKKSSIKKILIGVCVLLAGASAFAQPITQNGLNLPKFYMRRIHFGFSIAFNSTDFRVHTVPNSQLYHNLRDTIRYPNDTLNLKAIRSQAQPGFNLGIIVDVRLHQYLRLRFLPGVCFASRNLLYDFTGTRTFTAIRKTESAFVLLPLLLKLQSKRIKNYGVYAIGGASYSIDLSSGKNDKANSDVVRLKRTDVLIDVGGGMDFYFPYFKFAIEFKLSTGINNMIIQDGTEFTTPIQKLNTHIFTFGITFEG
ncbi:MAG: outer membrane beta-barrel protein [Bacteroidetes bacterium]|nr:outer membrane beta-barrel protein [Bacteroidota bacterium]